VSGQLHAPAALPGFHWLRGREASEPIGQDGKESTPFSVEYYTVPKSV